MNNDPNRPRNAGETEPPKERRDQCEVGLERDGKAEGVEPTGAKAREQSNVERVESGQPAQVTPAQKTKQPEARPPAEMGPPEGPSA